MQFAFNDRLLSSWDALRNQAPRIHSVTCAGLHVGAPHRTISHPSPASLTSLHASPQLANEYNGPLTAAVRSRRRAC